MNNIVKFNETNELKNYNFILDESDESESEVIINKLNKKSNMNKRSSFQNHNEIDKNK